MAFHKMNNLNEGKRRELVSSLVESETIRTESIRKSFLKVPRELFVLEEFRYAAYSDVALPMGCEGATISQPTTIAMMLEALAAGEGDKVLEVGSGSGYVLALLSNIVGRKGRVIGMETVPHLVHGSLGLLKKLVCANVKVICGDGSLGWAVEAPYDRILVSAAAPEIPKALKEQLGVGGRMVVPVGTLPFFQRVVVLEKLSETEFDESELGPFAFVPLRVASRGGSAKHEK